MSAPTLRQREARRVKDLARAYRSAGYHVTVKPPKSELPAFLRDFQPDLLAVSDDESVVVEVRSQADLVAANDIQSLATRVNEQPKWRFELVVTNPRHAQNDIVDVTVVWARLNIARQLSHEHNVEAALLLLWSATEAVLRITAEREKVNVEQLTPAAMVKQLATLGILNRDDQRILQQAASLRNTVAHGFASQTVEAGLVDTVSSVTERLLEDATSDQHQADSEAD